MELINKEFALALINDIRNRYMISIKNYATCIGLDAEKMQKDAYEDIENRIGELSTIESRPKAKWIEIKYRKPTEEEKERHPEAEEWFDCELPEHGEEVLVTTAYSNLIAMTTFGNFGDDGCEFEDYDAEDIIAWCRLPEPYIAEMRGEG